MPKASTSNKAKRIAPTATTAKPSLANVILLTRGKETPGAVRFEEAEVEGTPPSMGTLYVKRFFAGTTPSIGVHVDKTGSQPLENPVHPSEILATIYHSFGISPDTIVYNHLNQPRELVQADPITRFFA